MKTTATPCALALASTSQIALAQHTIDRQGKTQCTNSGVYLCYDDKGIRRFTNLPLLEKWCGPEIRGCYRSKQAAIARERAASEKVRLAKGLLGLG